MIPEHLGGHAGMTNIDSGSLQWLKNTFKAKSFLDIGCGPGGMVELANNNGLDALGIDGDYTLVRFDESKFLIHDFAKAPVKLKKIYDIGWSCEFVEHVYEKYIPNYITAFQSCKVIAMTYAPPGCPGHHHVNCQPEGYWITKMKQYGFRFDKSKSLQFRKSSTMTNGKKPKGFIIKRGLIFINEQI